MTKNIEDVKNLIQKNYFNLWNKTNKNPFVPGDLEKIYSKTDDLIIIDPDFQAMDKSLNTRQVGFDKIFSLLTNPWEYIVEGGITSIDTLELNQMGTNIMASIEAKGKMNFKDGKVHNLDRKVTQIWKPGQDGRWVIIYEHVS